MANMLIEAGILFHFASSIDAAQIQLKNFLFLWCVCVCSKKNES